MISVKNLAMAYYGRAESMAGLVSGYGLAENHRTGRRKNVSGGCITVLYTSLPNSSLME